MDTSGSARAAYWQTWFPVGAVKELLQITGSLEHTEIAVEAQTYYKRYQNAGEMEQLPRLHPALLALHVGATFSEKPLKRRSTGSAAAPPQPVRRPLVFDIDIQDYPFGVDKDDQEANDAVFPVVLAGVDILKQLLNRAFGFEHIVAFYSGRRGCHVYVVDERACRMTNEERAAVAAFVCPDTTSNHTHGRLTHTVLLEHPNFSELYDEWVETPFEEVVVAPRAAGGIGLFDNQHGVAQFLAMLDFKKVLSGLAAELAGRLDGPSRWTHLKTRVLECASERAEFAWTAPRLQMAVLSFVWPRIDRNVSTNMGHLLKIPFAPHKATGRIAVPIVDASSFALSQCPTIDVLDNLQAFVGDLQQFVARTKAAVADEPVLYGELSTPVASTESDIEDMVTTSTSAQPCNCVFQFERALHVHVSPTGVSHFRNVLRDLKTAHTRILWLTDDELNEAKERAVSRMPSVASLSKRLTTAFTVSTEGWKRLVVYKILYHVQGQNNPLSAEHCYDRLSARMQEQASETTHSLCLNQSDATYTAQLEAWLGNVLSPAFV